MLSKVRAVQRADVNFEAFKIYLQWLLGIVIIAIRQRTTIPGDL